MILESKYRCQLFENLFFMKRPGEGPGSGLVSCNFEKKLIKLKHGKTTKDRI